jgi:hypothetical protein
MLVLTVPLGVPGVDGFQRTYDVAGVHELLGGWDVGDLTVVRQADRVTWQPADPGDDHDQRRGVALVRARAA